MSTPGHGQRPQRLTRSYRSTSPTTTALGATQVSGAVVGTRRPRLMNCRCLCRAEEESGVGGGGGGGDGGGGDRAPPAGPGPRDRAAIHLLYSSSAGCTGAEVLAVEVKTLPNCEAAAGAVSSAAGSRCARETQARRMVGCTARPSCPRPAQRCSCDGWCAAARDRCPTGARIGAGRDAARWGSGCRGERVHGTGQLGRSLLSSKSVQTVLIRAAAAISTQPTPLDAPTGSWRAVPRRLRLSSASQPCSAAPVD